MNAESGVDIMGGSRPNFVRIGRRKGLPHLEISSAVGEIRGANGGKYLKIGGEDFWMFV
jgi:hypothetical protein